MIFKTRKDILCGGFSSINWKKSGDFAVDKKCFIFSLKEVYKLYKRLNDNDNLCFNESLGPWFGYAGSLGIRNSKFVSSCNKDPF